MINKKRQPLRDSNKQLSSELFCELELDLLRHINHYYIGSLEDNNKLYKMLTTGLTRDQEYKAVSYYLNNNNYNEYFEYVDFLTEVGQYIITSI